MAAEGNSFVHTACDNQFMSRSDAIFSGLANLEKKHEEGLSKDDPFAEIAPVHRQARHGRNRRPNRVPDHVLHPQKWTEYSLKEDGSEGYKHLTGDNLNKRVAAEFLQDLAKQRKVGNTGASDVNADEKIPFQKPVVSNKRKRGDLEDDDSDKSVPISNQGPAKFITMKTFEFGQKKEKPKQKEVFNKAGNGQLSLSHLEEIEDDENKTISYVKEIQEEGPEISGQEKHKTEGARKMKRNIRKPQSEEEN